MDVPSGAFIVYTTLSLNLDPVLRTLNYGHFGDTSHGDIWYPAPATAPSFVGNPVSAIIAHHRTQPGAANKRFLIVADRPDWETEGVLGVNLNFEGYIDAARVKANFAGSAIASVSVGNDDWHETIYDAIKPSVFALYPAYATSTSTSTSSSSTTDSVTPNHANKLRAELMKGLSGRKDGTEYGIPLQLLIPKPTTSIPSITDEDINPIAQLHRSISQDLVSQGVASHPTMFLVADEEDHDKWGVIVAKIDNTDTNGGELKVEQFRKPVDVAAEVLLWVDVGLLTWEEARVWDDDEEET